MQAGTSGLYEVLLIVLVVILIFNGYLRSKALSKINDNLDRSEKTSPKEKKGEYVDYEIISENTSDETNKLD